MASSPSSSTIIVIGTLIWAGFFSRWDRDRLFQAASLYPFFLNTWESSNFKRFSSLQEEAKPELKEQLDEVGFIYYLILARLEDLKPRKPDGKIIHQKKINPVVSKRQIHVQWLVYNSNLSWEMVKESTIGNNNKPHLMGWTNPFWNQIYRKFWTNLGQRSSLW